MDEEQPKENCCASSSESLETTCWGCGLQLLLSSYSPIFKCGWCGAITNRIQKAWKNDSACFSQWRRVRDHFFVAILFMFTSFIICAGLWAIYPMVFSISYFCGIFHCTLASLLAMCTISTFCLAAFLPAGGPAHVLWGSYPAVVKGGLDNYTFCMYCEKPKCPRTHHCRSCKTCVLDMDHHCPFICNCVGAANHRHFIAFLISIIVSCTYVVGMATYAGYLIWPPLDFSPFATSWHGVNNLGATSTIKDVVAAVVSSTLLLPARGLILVYLGVACFSVEIGICVLLWQQLQFIYQGKTYVSNLSLNVSRPEEKRGCQNILRFFDCPYWVFRVVLGYSHVGKSQETSYTKLL